MIHAIKVYAGSLLLGCLVFVACREPQPSPTVPPVACDNEAAHKLHLEQTCPNWSSALDELPDYCTDVRGVVPDYDWCAPEVSE